MASHPPQPQYMRQPPRRAGSRCSHSTRLDLPQLELGSNMTLQLTHERNGLLLQYAQSSTFPIRNRILRALHNSNVDLTKAQACGHCIQLTARLTESLLHHLLFAKGQLPEPVSLLRKRRQLATSNNQASLSQRSTSNSTRTRKQDKLLRKLDQLRFHLQDAANHLAHFAHNSGEGPSRRPYSAPLEQIAPNDVRLLVVMGASATMPREVFVLDLIQAVGRCTTTDDAIQGLGDLQGQDSSMGPDAQSADQDVSSQLAQLLAYTSDDHRDAARNKTSTNWERKLVRLLVSDQRLEPFFGCPLAPTKMHLFLSAPTSFRCPGWSARHHLDFDLDRLCEFSRADQSDLPTTSPDTSMSSPSGPTARSLKRAPSSPLHSPENTRWSKSACESSSSVADSWQEDDASDHLGESSISSVSDDSRPSSAAEKPWHIGGGDAASLADGWLPRCSSPLATAPHLQSVDTSRTGSSLGSSTVYGHDSHDVAVESSQEMVTECSSVHDIDLGVRRRSREPKAGSLLSRNLLTGNRSRHRSCPASDSGSVRSIASSLKRAPRCAGLQINFTDPEKAVAEPVKSRGTAVHQAGLERCWFQCEAVLEGFR